MHQAHIHRSILVVGAGSNAHLGPWRYRLSALAGDCQVYQSIAPEILEPIGCEFRIADCVLDVAMAKPCLEGPRIVAGVRQGETAGVSERVRVDRKRHPGALAEARDQCVEALGRHRTAPLRSEDVRSWRLLTLQTAQGTDLVTLDWMARGRCLRTALSKRPMPASEVRKLLHAPAVRRRWSAPFQKEVA